MTFIPYDDKIEIQAIIVKSIIKSDVPSLMEKGIVVSVGKNVKFVKPGDTLYFDSWGCMKTQEIDGVARYVVSESNQVILGKEEK